MCEASDENVVPPVSDYDAPEPRKNHQNKHGREIKKIPKRPPLQISKKNVIKLEVKTSLNTAAATDNSFCDKNGKDYLTVEENRKTSMSRRSSLFLNKLKKAQNVSQTLKSSVDVQKNQLKKDENKEKDLIKSNNQSSIKPEDFDFSSEEISEILSVHKKLSPPDNQGALEKKLLYPLLNQQSLISTNIYSGSLCTPKEYPDPMKLNNSLPSKFLLSPKIWSNPPTSVQTCTFRPPIKTSKGFVKVNPIQDNLSVSDLAIKKIPQLDDKSDIQSDKLKQKMEDCNLQHTLNSTQDFIKVNSVQNDSPDIDNGTKKTPKLDIKPNIQNEKLPLSEVNCQVDTKKLPQPLTKPSYQNGKFPNQPVDLPTYTKKSPPNVEEISSKDEPTKISPTKKQEETSLKLKKMKVLMQKLRACTAE